MKIQTRENVFETNSSSTHALCICTEQEYNDLQEGKKFISKYGGKVYSSKEEAMKDQKWLDEDDILTGPEFDEYIKEEWYEDFLEERVLPSGEKVFVFGYFGMDC